MKIVVAPDSFKGSLSASNVANIMERGIKEVFPEAAVIQKPMADGGEGTVEAFISSLKGKTEIIDVTCTGPLGDKTRTTYAIINKETAIIECAMICGLTMVPEMKRNPDFTTTYGLGEVILHAINRGCKKILIGLGGSATNDGGLGMLQALGMKAEFRQGESVGIFGKSVQEVTQVDFSGLEPRIRRVTIDVACDVDNPLCGPNGATAVYGPQKGARADQVETFDQALHHFGTLVEEAIGEQWMNHPGAGAAGGLGFAFLSIGAKLQSGAELIANEMGLVNSVKQANLVLTGEGQSDEQTLNGKAPGYVGQLAQQYGKPAILISGSLKGELDQLNETFQGCFAIVNRPMDVEGAMKHAETLLLQQVKQIMRIISIDSPR